MSTTLSIIYQTLDAAKFIHSKDCVHRDIKPENILLTKDGVVKVCDFGFARKIDSSTLTDYVATRWYRAPELLVGDTDYGFQVDIWAIGCVYIELITGSPLWPGKSDLDQLYIICKNVGPLLNRHLQIFKMNKYFQGNVIPEVRNIEPLEDKFPTSLLGVEGQDFMKKCLDKDPSKRWSSEQLLDHPLFKNVKKSNPDSGKLRTQNYNSILPQLGNLSNSSNGSPEQMNSPMYVESNGNGYKKNDQRLPTI